MYKKNLSERDICTKFITPALEKAGWDMQMQVLEEVSFTDGKIYVRGKFTARGKRKRADYILYYKPNIPVAIIEAKDNNHSVRSGIQQALDYSKILDIPCVFSSNGDGFLFHDRTATDNDIETELSLDDFPTPEELWERYKKFKGIETPAAEKIASQEYFFDGTNRKPRYYQQIAINRTVEAIGRGQNRILLVMATGTGKTYTAFQIAYRLWKAGAKKRILFLADRTALINQTRKGDFKHFKGIMTIIKKKVVIGKDGSDELVSTKKKGIDSSDKAFEIFLGLYQGLSNNEPAVEDAYKDFSPDFFDLVIIDECHRGSAKDDSNWREILTYFRNATHIGLTATPKETDEASNSEYFGEPVYSYSLRQGIDDGFLAPYRVIRIGLNVDAEGWRPEQGKTDKYGNAIEDRIYNRSDFDRKLVIDERTDTVAQKLTEFLKGYDRFAKTIVFCVDIDHAERMRSALARYNPDLVAQNHKYVMQITGDNDEGKRELDNFINPEEKYPVIATTSELMTTGVDAQTCKVIVLDANINSTTKFKQIIGRGTRINEEYGKSYFTILDFRNATDQFARPDFDGDPIRIKPVTEETTLDGIVDEEETNNEPIIDTETGEEIEMGRPQIRHPEPGKSGSIINEPRPKIYVNGVDVAALITRELHFDQHGKPITTSLKDHTKEIIKGQYASLDDFLSKWHATDRKEAIIAELQEQGVMVEALYEAVDKQVDLFDLICHVAFDQPPLTRKDRANNVKKRNYFTKYGEQTRRVLETLLDKYADEGIENIESMEVLQVKPLSDFGSTIEIVNGIFGSRAKYMAAVKDLETELYKVA
ncbi:EcoAI/FtnUII family type I restriction enzme subunit R [Adhaeribacter rhizoryzae]|uniref:DEAD/DEAH box helicase n=1 Tax=Adhaeribacter rhizoryzae TaxID=2607907 RepID=A0A5M6D3H1_9BACT|nr:DEAD/DEAH box helicase family protein [Adhaeribacter rhizoryzae]KAA5542058.1 DEAD/DEAH box helicase [Adhaeribacter rhizoryzae]